MSSGKVKIISYSKDSIYVRWKFDDDDAAAGEGPGGDGGGGGYQVSYQAVGSSVLQLSHLLDITASEYDITHLHENTNYNICVLRKRQPTTASGGGGGFELPTWSPTSWTTDDSICIEGTTSTDSLSVALGSTFGAFLALGLIVALVFVAKWQHSRRLKKRQQAAAEVAGNGVAAKADFEDDDDELPDDVLRVEIAELDMSKTIRYFIPFNCRSILL